MSSSTTPPPDSPPSQWSLNLPRRFVILPPTALLLGACIGISRGGSRARLRFLAENAHRLPTTIQGWYFYTKTRNYRILFGALREGAKTGLTLGAATGLYVLTEEGVRSLRNSVDLTTITGISRGAGTSRTRTGRGDSDERTGIIRTGALELNEDKDAESGYEWLDGGIAGSVLGGVISGFNRFPAPLFARTVLLGTTFGALEGCLRIAQGRIGLLKAEKEEEERRRRVQEEREREAEEQEKEKERLAISVQAAVP